MANYSELMLAFAMVANLAVLLATQLVDKMELSWVALMVTRTAVLMADMLVVRMADALVGKTVITLVVY